MHQSDRDCARSAGVDLAGAVFAQRRHDRHRPAGIDEVVDQEDGALGHRAGQAERALDVGALLGAVAHLLLWHRLAGLHNHRYERQLQPVGHLLGQARNQPGLAQ